MKLLTKTVEKRFAQVGSQAEERDPPIVAKFFNPTGAGTWYATEYDPHHRIFFGYVSIFGDWNDEWGSFSLDELASYRSPLGLGIEQDLHFGEKRLSLHSDSCSSHKKPNARTCVRAPAFCSGGMKRTRL